MNQDILLSKIVSNPTDTTWAQAYTTLNVYITLSIENSSGKGSVATYGKELLEKLQREFFALDEKSLENIKKAVSNVSKGITGEYKYSILVGAIVQNIFYIVIASEGQVIIKRGGRAGVIAKGVEGELHGFSGRLMHDDIVVLQTGNFAKKIPLPSLSEYLTTSDISEIAENITPLIHEESHGTEGAIILQFKDLTAKSVATDEFEIGQEASPEESSAKPDEQQENLWTKPPHENRNIEELVEDDGGKEEFEDQGAKKTFKLPTLPRINIKDKRIIILIAVVVLAAVLIGGITFQTARQNDEKREAEFAKTYQPAKNKYDEGVSLASLNSSLALEDLREALNMVNTALENYEEGSKEHQQLTELKSQIEEKIESLGGGGSAENVKEFLKPGGDLKSITAISVRAGELVVLDGEGEQVVEVSANGEIEESYDIESKDSHIASDDNFIYTLGTTVTRIDKGNGNITVVLEEAEGSALDIFGSNFYILNGDDILKFRAPSETSTSYFTEDPNFESKPTSISISGSIWVMEENGTLSRFTRGIRDDFEVTGLQAPFSSGALVYADPDSDNVYVMDVKNQRVVGLTSDGKFVKQYEGSFINNALSFAIDEESNTGYVVSNNKITSFDL